MLTVLFSLLKSFLLYCYLLFITKIVLTVLIHLTELILTVLVCLTELVLAELDMFLTELVLNGTAIFY